MRLYTLGRLELTRADPSGAETLVMGPQKPLAVLAYLALAPRRQATRERLLTMFWSDLPPERGRGTLRQALWMLRKHLGPDAIAGDRDAIRLVNPLRVDALDFLSDLESGNLAGAWEAYKGPFLPDFAAPGSAEFEHWADAERTRLRLAWMAAGEELARARLGTQAFSESAAIAGRLCEEDPDRLSAWQLLLEARLLAGDRVRLLLDAEALDHHASARGTRLPPALRNLLARVRQADLGGEPRTPGRLDPGLIGREASLATLLAAWRAAARGRGQAMAVEAQPGVGKTRLLGELAARLEGLGVRVVATRAWAADRDVSWGLAASLAVGLCRLPGALGLSGSSASILVGLAPELSSVFAGPSPAQGAPDDLRRLRTRALAELLEACADEGPFAILLDDLHWADSATIQLLASLVPRLSNLPILLVTASRPVRKPRAVTTPAHVVWLDPLTPAQVRQLIETLGSGEDHLIEELSRTVHAISSGTPLLVLAALEWQLRRGGLSLENGEWRCASPSAIASELQGELVLQELLADLPAAARDWLAVLALARQPLNEAALAAVSVGHLARPSLVALEARGLLAREGDDWVLGHDWHGEAALSLTPDRERREIARRLANHLLATSEAGNPRTLQLAGRLYWSAGREEAAQTFRRWLEAVRDREFWRDPMRAAGEFLGEESASTGCDALAATVGRTARLRHGYPGLALALALVTVATGGTGAVLLARSPNQPPAAVMALTEPPASRDFIWTLAPNEDSNPGATRSPVPSAVEFLDAAGQPTANAPAAVEVHLAESWEGQTLGGTTTVKVSEGRATFNDLVVIGSGPFRLEYRAGALPPVQSRRLYAAHERRAETWRTQVRRLKVQKGQLNGQAMDSVARRIIVSPGERLAGLIEFSATTAEAAASILVGAIALWGDRRTNYMALKALPSYGFHQFRVPLADAITGREFVAPETPGTYRVLLLQAAETEIRFVASHTNWKLGAPIWYDGDDLADLPESALRVLDTEGMVPWPRLLPGLKPGDPSLTVMGAVTGTTIEIIVSRTGTP